jgi:hypothetical protein
LLAVSFQLWCSHAGAVPQEYDEEEDEEPAPKKKSKK